MTYYRYEVGHMLHVTPEQVGQLTPAELLAAVRMFEGVYLSGG